MLRFIYTILLYVIQPLIWLRLLIRSRKSSGYRQRILERYGFCKHKVSPNAIVVHSVSVGETVAAIPLIKSLQQSYPAQPILVTTMTVTGSDLVRKTFAADPQIKHVYLPYDLPCVIHRFLKTVQPSLFIILETELWPNLIYALSKRKIPLILANARLSERSAKRYAKLNRFWGQNMRQLLEKITMIAAQNQADSDRFLALGLPKNQLSVTGTIKYDIQLTNEQKQTITQLKTQWQLQHRLVWIAASTHQGEDEMILTTHQTLLNDFPDLVLILVPRHPERFVTVENLIKNNQLSYQTLSDLKLDHSAVIAAQTNVILGNTMGDLPILYGLSDIAFIGGSLIERGGHNPLEAALHQLPMIMGQYTFNFQSVCDQLESAQALFIVNSNDQLTQKIKTLLQDPRLRTQMGLNGAQVLAQNQGALDRLLAIVSQINGKSA